MPPPEVIVCSGGKVSAPASIRTSPLDHDRRSKRQRGQSLRVRTWAGPKKKKKKNQKKGHRPTSISPPSSSWGRQVRVIIFAGGNGKTSLGTAPREKGGDG